MRKYLIYILLLFILILGAFFRFYRITEAPPGLYPDEAMNGNNALEALATGNFKWFYPENNGREGLFINIQALSVWFFGNEPWALRVISALFGTLTILGVYLISQELFTTRKSQFPNPNFQSNSNNLNPKRLEIKNLEFGISRGQYIGLLSSFFLATSYWHINFSRIGFRAIMVPFLATFGLYFLLKGLRTGKISALVVAGIFIGLGFHTYIAFRFMPFVIATPIIFSLAKWLREKYQISNIKYQGNETSGLNTKFLILDTKCIPCAVALFLFITFIVALPIGYYFLQYPEDFLGRGEQVSIFAADSPLYEFAKSNLLTLQMFFWKGDCNWRHNYNCQPELHPLVALFFAVGFILLIKGLFKIPKTHNLEPTTLFVWLAVMSFPATLTKEGLPHALRAIGMIPPVMILAGLGAWQIGAWVLEWLDRQKEKWPKNFFQIVRIQLELTVLFILIPLWIPNTTFKDYFFRWASHPETYFSFSADLWHLGRYLNGLPQDTLKYVVVNMRGVPVRGIPMPAQTVMFATDTFGEEKRAEKNIKYIPYPGGETYIIDMIEISPQQKTIIALLDGDDRETKDKIREEFPDLKFHAPGDFMIFTNSE